MPACRMREAEPGKLRVSSISQQRNKVNDMLRRILVGDNERVLLIRNKRFENILGPGEYRLLRLFRGIELERYNTKALVFTSDWADFIVNQRPELASRYFTVVETAASEVAVVSLDGRIARVIAASTPVVFSQRAVAVA